MEKIEPYIGKTAKFSWYSLQDGWVYKNNARRVLSLEVKDQQLLTYEEEKHKAANQNKHSLSHGRYHRLYYTTLKPLPYLYAPLCRVHT